MISKKKIIIKLEITFLIHLLFQFKIIQRIVSINDSNREREREREIIRDLKAQISNLYTTYRQNNRSKVKEEEKKQQLRL